MLIWLMLKDSWNSIHFAQSCNSQGYHLKGLQDQLLSRTLIPGDISIIPLILRVKLVSHENHNMKHITCTIAGYIKGKF